MTIHPELQKLDKWMSGVDPQQAIRQAASYSLNDRIACFHQFFACAAISRNDSVENIHQLRVATRRVQAVLELYGKLLRTKPTKLLQRSLKKIHRASGKVRDLDVLANRYSKIKEKTAKDLLKSLVRRRSKTQLGLAKLFFQLSRKDRLLKRTGKILAKIRNSHADEPVGDWMKLRWLELVEQFYQSADCDTENLAALHRFRLCCKQLRYGLELLAPAFDGTERERAYEFVESLQDRLGRLHDHVIAINMFSQWNAKRNRTSKVCDLTQLTDQEAQMLKAEQREFTAWWTPALKADIRLAFDQLAT